MWAFILAPENCVLRPPALHPASICTVSVVTGLCLFKFFGGMGRYMLLLTHHHILQHLRAEAKWKRASSLGRERSSDRYAPVQVVLWYHHHSHHNTWLQLLSLEYNSTDGGNSIQWCNSEVTVILSSFLIYVEWLFYQKNGVIRLEDCLLRVKILSTGNYKTIAI